MSDSLIQQLWDALKSLILWIVPWLYHRFLEALSAVLLGIPVPDCFGQAANLFASIPPEVMFWLEPVHLDTFICIIIDAYVIRFLIRRLPFIG